MQQQQQFPTVGVRTIVKLGGAAITDKAVLETPNLPVLQLVAQHLAAAATADGSAGHAGASMVVVHGAGSFGHFQASDYGVAKGWGPLTDPTVRKGFCLTRASVTRLNNLVLQALLDAGLPACALSPCGTWTTTGRQPTSDGAAAVAQLLRAGLVPVLHGDAVLDHELGCTILSGDVLVRRLAEALTPACVVFLTNVAGIYDSPPDASPGAGGTGPAPQLIEVIDVQADGSWTVAAPPSLAGLSSHGSSGSSGAGIRFEAAAHDTTGGIAAKVAEAAAIAMLGVDVLIAQAGSQDGARACSQGAALFAGAANGGGSSGWRGTWVRRAAVPCSSPARSPARDVLI